MISKFYRYIIEKDAIYTKEYFIDFINEYDILVPLIDNDYQWAKSTLFDCSNCKLKQTNEYCNLALQLSYFINFFAEFNSYDNVIVTVQTNTYTITKATTIQQTALSILNLIIPFSGCPTFQPLMQAARNHIPFEPVESLLIRVLGFYSFEMIKNKTEYSKNVFDQFLNQINQMHEPIRNICNIIRKREIKDASVNSLILLDSYLTIMSDMLEYSE